MDFSFMILVILTRDLKLEKEPRFGIFHIFKVIQQLEKIVLWAASYVQRTFRARQLGCCCGLIGISNNILSLPVGWAPPGIPCKKRGKIRGKSFPLNEHKSPKGTIRHSGATLTLNWKKNVQKAHQRGLRQFSEKTHPRFQYEFPS